MPQALQFENFVRGKRILVVDDEKYILDFFVEVFQPFPMQVDTASNGRAAMRKMMTTEYDLVISDFKMPQMSGKELYGWIKENRPQLANCIIFVTGDTVSLETRSFFEDNKNRYLAKPFKIEEVKEVIQQALESAAMLSAISVRGEPSFADLILHFEFFGVGCTQHFIGGPGTISLEVKCDILVPQGLKGGGQTGLPFPD